MSTLETVNLFDENGNPTGFSIGSVSHIPIPSDVDCNGQVAGELLPIDSAALFIAGIQSVSAWLVPTAAGIAATGFYLVRHRKHN